MTLQEEAMNYAKKVNRDFVASIDFEAGANSKYVQAEKLKFAIEQLEKVRLNQGSSKYYAQLDELKQQLKELES
jgi:hypothetical protein